MSSERNFVKGARVGLRVLGLLLAAASLAMAQSPTQASDQSPEQSAVQSVSTPPQLSASLPQSVGTSQSDGNAQSAAPAPQRSGGSYDKDRFSVNPVTGQVTSPAEQYVPLTNQERWKLYWKQNYLSVGAYFGPLFTAAVLDQTSDSPREWGRGIGGYGLRFASRLTGTIIQASIQAPAAAVLHEDVRYIASPKHGFKRRTAHAIVYSFLTYNSHGHPTLNISNLGAYYASTAISTTWLPDRYNVGEYTLTNGSEQIALTLPVNLVQEFWPDIVRIAFHRGS